MHLEGRVEEDNIHQAAQGPMVAVVGLLLHLHMDLKGLEGLHLLGKVVAVEYRRLGTMARSGVHLQGRRVRKMRTRLLRQLTTAVHHTKSVHRPILARRLRQERSGSRFLL